MRTLTRTLALLLACSLVVVGCDSLNLNPKDELASDQVWQDETLTRSYLNDIYSNIGWGFGDPMIAGLADEAHNTHGHGDAQMRLSNMSPSWRGTWDWGWEEVIQKYQWSEVYSNARDLNIFIKNVKQSEALPQSTKETMLGEAYFLRAFFYHNLMRLYGGVPYITGTFSLSGDLEQYKVPRNTFEETVNMLAADLDSAQARLPDQPRRKGAATKGAAMALKSRVLLHAASDLFHESPFSGEAAQYVSYTGGSQQQRWQKALDAANAVINSGQYSLEPVNSPQEYHELFTSNADHSGKIWARYFKEEGGESHDQSLWVSPNGYNSWSGDTPTQEHVNAYEMADGSDFQWQGGDPRSASSPVDVSENPYENRDPRFYANIHYNGSDWRPRPPGLQSVDPKGVIQTGWYEDPDNGGSASEPGIQGTPRAGLDTRESGIQNWNGTKTGYNLKKFVSQDVLPAQEQAYNPWQFIRYAEILLNKAEAAANLGQLATARQALNKVRSRVGMPDVTTSNQAELLKEIRQEREVELAFEEFRYFDVRRWKIAPEVYTPAHKVRIEGELDPNGEMLVDNRYNFKYNVTQVDERQWNDRAYFLPISQDEINKNSKLVQNPGYN